MHTSRYEIRENRCIQYLLQQTAEMFSWVNMFNFEPICVCTDKVERNRSRKLDSIHVLNSFAVFSILLSDSIFICRNRLNFFC